MSEMIYDQYGNPLFVPTNPGSVMGQTSSSQPPIAVTQAPKGPYQTLVNLTGTITTSATLVTTVQLQQAGSNYSVPSGKTLYITDVLVTNPTANAAALVLNDSSTINAANTVLNGHSINTSPLEMSNIGSEPMIRTAPYIQVQAVTGAPTLGYTVYGYIQ